MDLPDQTQNLPAPVNTFIGREKELQAIKANISDKVRMFTLTGPGGSGKTRLALQAGRELVNTFNEGVWLIELGAVSSGESVPQTVAAAMEISAQSKQTVSDRLIEKLSSRSMLILLDNCEHLLPACANLCGDLLGNCPNLRILATSREPLNIDGEFVWQLSPLSLPESHPWRAPGDLERAFDGYRQSEAIQLFLARAGESVPGFELTAKNVHWVIDICRRLDGIPLAIELAAARLRAFSPQQIAERLDNRFEMLDRKDSRLLRQQTLVAAFDWSYNLLSEDEQRLFQRLSVFSDGWTLEAAEAVCSGEAYNKTNVAILLGSLVDKSLVVVERNPEGHRYRLLETIGAFANEKLESPEERKRLRDRHLVYFMEWVKKCSHHLIGPDQTSWLDKFEAEHSNILHALEWSLGGDGDPQHGLQIARWFGQFWRLRGYLSEGRTYLKVALDHRLNQNATEDRAEVLLWEANLAYLQSDYSATRDQAEKALEICSQLGSAGKPGTARAYDILGELATELGEYSTALPLFEKALHMYRDLGEKRAIADMLIQLGWAEMRLGNYQKADRFLGESLPMLRALNDTAMLGLVLSGLGELSLRLGDVEKASRLLEESLEFRRNLGDRWGIAASLGSLGWGALIRGEFDKTRQLLSESIHLRVDLEDQGGIAWCLEKLAESLVLQSKQIPAPFHQRGFAQAVRILSAADYQRSLISSVIDPADLDRHENLLAGLKTHFSTHEFEMLWQQAKNMPLDQVVEVAVAPILTDEERQQLLTKSSASNQGGLTPREWETAVHVSKGRSNRQIAERMTVREKTVETYITRILNKLDFNSRVQIATWMQAIDLDQDRPESG